MSKYPIGTKAYSSTGGHWLKIGEGKWKAQSGCVFPRYGGDAVRFELPKYLDKSEITDELLQELGRVPCLYDNYLDRGRQRDCILLGLNDIRPETSKLTAAAIRHPNGKMSFVDVSSIRVLRSTVDEMRKAKEAE